MAYLKKILLYGLSFIFLPAARGQEMNIGFHINPTFTVPVLDRHSVYSKELGVRPATLFFNIGFNANFKLEKMAIETGINIVPKSIAFTQNYSGRTGVNYLNNKGNYSKIIANSTSVELPLLLSVRAGHHDKKTVYDTYIVAGTSFEYIFAGSSSSESIMTSQGNQGTQYKLEEQYTLPGPSDNKAWANIIAGFKINAIVRHFGLIDYGLTYHFPLTRNEPYQVKTTVMDYTNKQDYTYTGDYHPYLSYIDIKLCYYFWNLDNGWRRMRYNEREEGKSKTLVGVCSTSQKDLRYHGGYLIPLAFV